MENQPKNSFKEANASPKEAEIIYQSGKDAISGLKNQIEAGNRRIKELEKLLAEKGSTPEPQQDPGNSTGLPEYKGSWTWAQKIIYSVKLKERPLLLTEIINSLHEVEPGIYGYVNAYNNVSAHVAQVVKNMRLIPYKVRGQRGYYYAHPTWYNEKRELKPEYIKKLNLL